MARTVIGLGVFAWLACGSEPSDDPQPTTAASVTTSTDPSSAEATGAQDSSTGLDATTTGVGTADASEASADASTSTDGPQACDPPMAPFLAMSPALPQAAILIDVTAETCAAASAAGQAPQIVLDVQMSGLINATLFGFEIVDVSSGQPFDDPPSGDSLVIDLQPDLPITFETTAVSDGAPVTISFEIFSTGPTLLDVRAEFG